MVHIPQTFSVRDLQRQYRTILNVAKQAREPVLLVNNSAPEAVLIDLLTFRELVQDDYLWDEDLTLKRVQQAEASHRQGKSKRLKRWDDLDR